MHLDLSIIFLICIETEYHRSRHRKSHIKAQKLQEIWIIFVIYIIITCMKNC